ncbi:MAG: nuclear transport factor 2 family protein [Ferruginibacter sp.]
MKKIIGATLFLIVSIHPFAQSKEAGTDREAIKQFMNNKDTMPALSYSKDADAVKKVLNQYKDAVEKLDVNGTEKLFTTDSKIYESGGSEGNYVHYLEHHLTPEFKEFKSFKYNDYKIEVQVDGDYAFATETYNYVIVVAKDNAEVKRKGVSTSVVKKIKGEWKIWISHNSSRK